MEEIIEVFHENELAVDIYQHLRIEIQVTLGGSFYTGFNRGDIKEMMDIFEVPKDQRIDTLQRLTILEKRTVNMLNKRSK